MYFILVYDISMDEHGARVLRHVFKICKKYLNHVQCSVFEGELSPVQAEKLKAELFEWIRKDLDSVILFRSRQEKWMQKEFLGKNERGTTQFL